MRRFSLSTEHVSQSSYLEGAWCWYAKKLLGRGSINEYSFSIRRRSAYCCIVTFPDRFLAETKTTYFLLVLMRAGHP